MSKRPLGHGDIRGMSNFKASAMDYAYYLSLSEESSLYCLTDRQIYILLAQLDYVGWLTRWYNTEDITQSTVGFIRSELELALLSCVDISVLVDQGKLNLTRDVQNQQIQSQGLRDIYEDRYDGSPTSINPDAPTTNFGSTGDRYDALCAALTAYIYQYANAQTQAVVAGDIAAFALLVGAALLLIPGLNLFYIAGASLALIAGGGIIGVTSEVAIAALTDTEALDNVICYLQSVLKAQSVTQANFAACLDSYPFTVGSNEAIVCDFLKPTLSDNYFGFLDMLGQAYSGLINGEPVPACPCGTRTPVINSLWDPAHIAGTLSGPDETGLWTATSGNRTTDQAITLMDVFGRPFVLTDITYSEPLACQVWLLDGVMLHIACGIGDQYTGQTIDEYTVTWGAGAARTMTFRMVAP